jgi:hypothetical protein
MTLRSPTGAVLLRTAARSIAPVAALCLAACSSSKAPKRSEFGPTYEERMNGMDNVIKGKDYSMRSSFEKQIPKNSTEKGYKTSTFNTKETAGIKKFSGAENAYHSKSFFGADKKSRTEQKLAREAEAQNKLASRLFRTPDSRFNVKSSPDGGKTFTQGNETFATGENRAGTKALEKNKKPVILDPDKPTYSEDEVKRLLNKG